MQFSRYFQGEGDKEDPLFLFALLGRKQSKAKVAEKLREILNEYGEG